MGSFPSLAKIRAWGSKKLPLPGPVRKPAVTFITVFIPD
jgi:hypothetical protein